MPVHCVVRFLEIGKICLRGGLGMNVARMCGGIIMIAGPELAPRVIWPRPKDFRPPDMISD